MSKDTEVHRRNYDGGSSTDHDTVLSVREWPEHDNKLIVISTNGGVNQQTVLVDSEDREQFLTNLRDALFPPRTERIPWHEAQGRAVPGGGVISGVYRGAGVTECYASGRSPVVRPDPDGCVTVLR